MTVESYIEMCEIMGDPVDPTAMVELEDFPEEIQAAFEMYNYLPDEYLSTMESITYMGKDITKATALFELYDVSGNEESRMTLWALKKINDRVKKKSLAKSKSKSNKPNSGAK